MKVNQFLPAVGLLVISVHAAALDFTPDATRIISDPTYLPSAGEIYGTTAYAFDVKSSADVKTFTGAKAYSFRDSSSVIAQTFAYGITDELTIQISQSFTPSQKKTFSDSDTSYRYAGLNDPELSATFRALDQKSSPVSLDITAAYSPNLINSKIPSTGEQGTVAQGGQYSSLSSGVGFETQSFTVRGEIGVDYLAQAESSERGNDDKENYSSQWNKSIGLETQTRINNIFSVNVNLIDTSYGDQGVTNEDDSAGRYQEKEGDEIDAQVTFNYHIIPERLVGQLEYYNEWRGNLNRRYDNPQFIYYYSTTSNRELHGMVVRLRYTL